ARQRVVLHGGANALDVMPTHSDDTWEWDGSTWTQVTGTQPPPRMLAAATYEDARRATLVAGGFAFPISASDVWSFDGTTWEQRAPLGALATRVMPTVAYDRASRASFLFGGLVIGGSALQDTWGWDGESWRGIQTAEAPPERGAHVSFPAPD